ncbi:acyl-CoA dehydrogenase family protein [Enterovirga aerilata]|uniref:Acyl-CoA/acyl-ACP dehydrogenase n=1 Tax=Enterovirga aerilata TaxID=2730920 RepID=A0A849IDM9_9HYPH|nr:acyl-CoA dehydrogenase family protein [Enterovirga sp. DB1703]NNM74140.1 acyl-CoA/acyl-ACP dehydrogenase [Enterovirga sp. DB1703]
MNFDFSEEQFAFRDSVRQYLDDRWSVAQLRTHLTGDGFDRELWEGVSALGILAMMVPEEHGGLGLGYVDLALILEECGRHLVPGPAVDTIIATDIISRHGTPEQQAALLPAIAEGGLKIAAAVAEIEGGFRPEDTTTIARPSGNGWALSGRKILVPYAESVDQLLVVARFGDDGPLGLVLVDPDWAGITRRHHQLLDPASRAHEVTFSEVELGGDHVLGGQPLETAVARLVDAGAASASLQMTGAAGKVLDLAVEYTGNRVQFGKPIGSFQAIKHRCADMLVLLETSRTAAYHAAWALAHDPAARRKLVSMAKAYCGDAARSICNEGLQLHGGIGFTWELDIHFYLRRAKTLEYSYGDASAHRECVMAATLAEMEAA